MICTKCGKKEEALNCRWQTKWDIDSNGEPEKMDIDILCPDPRCLGKMIEEEEYTNV